MVLQPVVRSRSRLVAVGAAVLTVAALFTAPAAASAAPQRAPSHRGHGTSLPAVYPTPQSMTAHGSAVELGSRVGLVTGDDSDADAVAALTSLLTAGGVKKVDTVADVDDLAHHEAAIYVGGPGTVAGAADALKRLGVEDASALPAEGYVLADGRIQGRATIVLDGHDGAGAFYAVQTLRQLISSPGDSHSRSHGHANSGIRVPGVRVRDWPGMALRGVIEGFYGAPWTDAERADQLAFYGRNKMNTYIYSPKDDPYLRAQWRDTYPADKLAAIKKLVTTANANHVQFTYAISPGLSVCYSSATDEKALIAKLQSMWDVGVRSFSIPFDDISYSNWNCSADKTKFGAGSGGAAGAAQSYFLNEIQKDFIDTHAGADPLETVPTEYYNVSDSAYKTALRNDLSQKVIVGWTGTAVIPATITAAQAKQAQQVFGHKILLWDNYPVNDYVTGRLLMGPYTGREAGLTSQLYGITANPMIEPGPSKVALFDVADYSWNSPAYDPETTWKAGLDALAGPNPQAQEALAAFADLEHASPDTDLSQAPVLKAKIASFEKAWQAGDTGAARSLDSYLRVIERIPDTLTAHMGDPAFVSQARPWLDAASAWGTAARDALRMLVAERHGDAAAALADRTAALAAAKKAKGYTWSSSDNAATPVLVGDGVIDAFVSSALTQGVAWFGLTGRDVTVSTSLSTYQTNVPANMVDGDASTFFWSSRAANKGDDIELDLGSVGPIGTITINGGDAASPDDYIHNADLQYSSDGTTWTTLGSYTGTADISATPPDGTTARYVRLVATKDQTNWVKIHTFSVARPAADELKVTGSPAAASGTSLADAADGDIDTAYTASAATTTGDALTATLPKARPLSRVGVIASATGKVQIEVDGDWVTIGSLAHSGYTEADARGKTASAIRIAFAAGQKSASVTEIVPWYADVPAAALSADPSSVETTVGATTKLTLDLSATLPEDQVGRLTVSADRGLRTPRSRTVRVDRATDQTLTVSVTGEKAGTYPVTIAYRTRGEKAVTAQVTVTVHPKVSDTNVAAAADGAVATASSTEEGIAQFAPKYAIDGDATTRWSSNHDDGEWLQVQFAHPVDLGKVVISWEAAYATSYKLETSTDGTHWTTADTVTDGHGGTETDWIDQSGVSYLRMQGVSRATPYGYSIYELQAFPFAG